MKTLRIIERISLDGVIQVSGDVGGFPCGDWTHHSPFYNCDRYSSRDISSSRRISEA